MIKSNHKERRKNHGGQRRGVNYMPRHYKNTVPINCKPQTVQVESYAKSLPEKEYGKLTKTVVLSLYTDSKVPFDTIKELREVYSEESLVPEGKSKFQLPMSKAIMPPRKTNNYEAKEAYGHYCKTEEDNDQGIFKGVNTSHSNVNHAPLWYDSEVIPGKEETDSKAEDAFSMENMASKQFSLEEEKAKFNKQLEHLGTKVNPESLFNNIDDNGYSNVDVKYESLLKGNSKIAQELFANSSAEVEGDAKAIDLGNIEAEMLKGDKQKEIEKEEGEEVPIWNAYSAEEIKQQSKQDFGSWGQNLNTIQESFIEHQVKEKTESENPFCHLSFNIKETDKAWYYCDTQNFIQGPFNSIEMYAWYKGGYFPSNLPVRCGKYSPFVPLSNLLNSIKMRQEVEMQTAVQYFNSGNMRNFFGPAMSVEGSKASAPLSLEELESGFIAPAYSLPYQQSNSYRNYDPRPYHPDPAIASLRPELATESSEDKTYTRDEAHDLKALLGVEGNPT